MFKLKLLLSVLSLYFLTIALPFTYAEDEPQTVDINSADAWTLMYVLDGVGKKKAGAIVKYRDENGLFDTIYDLDDVPGIGLKTIMKNKDKIVVVIPKEETEQTETSEETPEGSEEESQENASAENKTEKASPANNNDVNNTAETSSTPTSNQTADKQ